MTERYTFERPEVVWIVVAAMLMPFALSRLKQADHDRPPRPSRLPVILIGSIVFVDVAATVATLVALS